MGSPLVKFPGRRIVGLDLGQAADPTAIAVLEAAPQPSASPPTTLGGPAAGVSGGWSRAASQSAAFDMRYLERLPLGRPYPEYVAHVVDLMRTPELRRATLVIDYTGVGRPIFDMFDQVPGINPIGILITAGNAVTRHGRIYHVPKRDLATSVLALLQSKRLRVSSALPESQVLVTELLNFRVKVTLGGTDQYEAWREGDHDDYVLATAVASWFGLHVPVGAVSPSAGGTPRLANDKPVVLGPAHHELAAGMGEGRPW